MLHRHKIRTLSDERICVALVNDCDALSSRLTLISELEAVEAAVEADPGAEDCLLDLQRTLRQQCATKAIDTVSLISLPVHVMRILLTILTRSLHHLFFFSSFLLHRASW